MILVIKLVNWDSVKCAYHVSVVLYCGTVIVVCDCGMALGVRCLCRGKSVSVTRVPCDGVTNVMGGYC